MNPAAGFALTGGSVRELNPHLWRVVLGAATSRQSLADKVYQHLSSQLANQSLKIGQRINARQLAEELVVSRTTVNKAIDRLEEAGWVKPDEGRHPVVTAYPTKLKLHTDSTFEFANQTDTTYELLLERILRGQYKPGEILKERRLGQDLNVNPATVRRAAEWLRNNGLLKRLPRRGWQVSILAARDLKDVYQIRLLLEPLAFAAAIQRVPDSTLEELADESDRMIAMGEEASVYDRRHADHKFHQLLSEASGNRMLAETLEPLIRKSLLMTTVGFRFQRASRSFEEHKEIVDAVRARDEKLAVKRLKLHLRNALKFNVDIWERE